MTAAFGSGATSAARRLVVPSIAALAALCVLIGLGVWQLQRLAWKEALLAEILVRMAAPPAQLPPEATWPALDQQSYAYRHVAFAAVFDFSRGVQVFEPAGVGTVKNFGPGYLMMTPVRLASGAIVYVDRGYLPADPHYKASRTIDQPTGQVTVTGLMRPPETSTFFAQADNPERGEWFNRDPAAMAKHFGLQRVAPFSVDQDGSGDQSRWPAGGQTVVAIPNDHLAYAFTWFGLAATLIGVFGVFAYGQVRAARS